MFHCDTVGKEESRKEERNLIIFTDSGDTLIDEGSEVRKEEGGVVYAAEFIPGAEETLRELKARGYRMVLVADGLKESFDRIYAQHHMEDIFEKRAVSETIGEEKPSAKMFETAMKLMGLKEEDKKRIIMVGNNIKRDIVGANRFGIHSVLMAWSPRYCMVPETEEETPEYRIEKPVQLLELVERLENMV